MLPSIPVSHLPSAASFYSAVCQPLGLRYLAPAAPGPDSAAPAVFGRPSSPPKPLLQLIQLPPGAARAPSRSRLVLAAPSARAVNDVHACALVADPRLARLGPDAHFVRPGRPASDADASHGTGPGPAALAGAHARVTDADGNVMEVVYGAKPPARPARDAQVRRTQSTTDEVCRILDWNYDVAASSPPPRRALARYPTDDPRLAASVARRGADQPLPGPAPPANAQAVVGTLLGAAAGAAAGAALTYGMISRSQARVAMPSSYDAGAASSSSSSQRRATFPDQVSSGQPPLPRLTQPDDRPLRRLEYPAPPPARSREADDVRDGRSRVSSHCRPVGSSTARSRSEVSTSRRPLMITDTEHRSHVGSKHGPSFSSRPPPVRRHDSAYDAGAREGTVYRAGGSNQMSRASASTVRPATAGAAGAAPGAGPTQTEIVHKARAGNRVTVTTITVPGQVNPAVAKSLVRDATAGAGYVPPRQPIRPASQVAGSRAGGSSSFALSRNVPLPASHAGSSASGWRDDDSIAPSESISNVGIPRSRMPRSRSYR